MNTIVQNIAWSGCYTVICNVQVGENKPAEEIGGAKTDTTVDEWPSVQNDLKLC